MKKSKVIIAVIIGAFLLCILSPFPFGALFKGLNFTMRYCLSLYEQYVPFMSVYCVTNLLASVLMYFILNNTAADRRISKILLNSIIIGLLIGIPKNMSIMIIYNFPFMNTFWEIFGIVIAYSLVGIFYGYYLFREKK